MKIAILTPGGVDRSGTGNVIPCLLWLIERLVRHGHEVHVFAAAQEPDPGRWPLLGASVHNAGRAPRSVRILRDLAREHRRGRFDVIHAFWAKYGTVGAVARRLLGVPLVLTLPGGDVVGLRDIGFGGLVTGRGGLILHCAVAAADAINTPSRFMRDLAIAHGIDAEHVVLGVDAQAFPPLAPRARDALAPIRLLHVASLNRVKDQPTLLGAMAILRARGVPFVLDVIGEDTLGGAIQALAASLELGRAVRFHGLVPFADVRPWYERADLLVVSSRHEAGPLVTLEAAMAGVPTVGTCVGHIADLSPEAALAVLVGDCAALASGIEALSRDEPRRLRTAAAAQAFAVERDADYTCSRFEATYRALATRSSRGVMG